MLWERLGARIYVRFEILKSYCFIDVKQGIQYFLLALYILFNIGDKKYSRLYGNKAGQCVARVSFKGDI